MNSVNNYLFSDSFSMQKGEVFVVSGKYTDYLQLEISHFIKDYKHNLLLLKLKFSRLVLSKTLAECGLKMWSKYNIYVNDNFPNICIVRL